MRYSVTLTLIFAACAAVLSSCEKKPSDTAAPLITVTNTYLQSACADVLGSSEGIICISPPGMCPAHFDISPSLVKGIAESKVLVYFDFESGARQSLRRLVDTGLETKSITAPPGLSLPESYLAVCSELADVLKETFPARATEIDANLSAVKQQLTELSARLPEQVKSTGLTSSKVITSEHQKLFCEFLGFKVVAVFGSKDTATASQIDNCISTARQNNVKYVIANAQESAVLADSLAKALDARIVIFSNFPLASPEGGFFTLIESNMQSLLENAR